MTVEIVEGIKPTMINPRDYVRKNPIFAALPAGAFVGKSFDVRYYNPVYLVPVQHGNGHVIHMLYDGQRRAALAVRDNVPQIEAVFLGQDFVQEHYPNQTVFKPAQFVKLMRELHNSKSDDRRIASQILREWQITVGDIVDQRSSALAALFYLNFSNLVDKTPGEIKTIVGTPNHSKYPGDLVFAQTIGEKSVIAQGLSSMAASVEVVDISYENMLRHALWVVQQMINSEDPDMQAAGRKQLRGLLSNPQVNRKITSQTKDKAVIEKRTDMLEIALIESTAIIKTAIPESVTHIRLMDTVLKDPYLSYEQTVLVLSPDRRSLADRYDDMKREINFSTLRHLYKDGTDGAEPSSFVQDLLRRFSGTTILDPLITRDRFRIDTILNAVYHAVDFLAVHHMPQSWFLSRIDGVLSPAGLKTRLIHLERELGIKRGETGGFDSRTTADSTRSLAKNSKDHGESVVFPGRNMTGQDLDDLSSDASGVEVTAAEGETLLSLLDRLTVKLAGVNGPDDLSEREFASLASLGHRLTGMLHGHDAEAVAGPDTEPSIVYTAKELAAMLKDVSLAEDLPEGAELVLGDVRGGVNRLFPPVDETGEQNGEIDWQKVIFNPDTDGKNASWFHDKLRHALTETDRHKITLLINQAAQRKVFSKVHGSWDTVLAGIHDGKGNVGLTAIDTALSSRFAQFISALNWDKTTPEFIFLAGNHYALAVNQYYESLVQTDQDTGDYEWLSKQMADRVSDFKKNGPLSIKTPAYFELLQILLYTDFNSAANKNARSFVKSKASDGLVLKRHIDALYGASGYGDVHALFTASLR